MSVLWELLMEKMRSSGIPSALYNVHPQTVKVCHFRIKEPLVGRDVRENSGFMSHSPGLTGAAEQSWPRGAKCRAPTEPGLQGWAVHSSISFNMHYPVNIPFQISTQLTFRSIFFGKTPPYHFSLPSEEELGSNIFSTVHWSICRLLWVILWELPVGHWCVNMHWWHILTATSPGSPIAHNAYKMSFLAHRNWLPGGRTTLITEK